MGEVGELARQGRDGPVVIARDEIVALAVPSRPAGRSFPLVLGPFPWWTGDRPATRCLALHIFPIVAGLASVLIFVSQVAAVGSHRSRGFMRQRSTSILRKTHVNRDAQQTAQQSIEQPELGVVHLEWVSTRRIPPSLKSARLVNCKTHQPPLGLAPSPRELENSLLHQPTSSAQSSLFSLLSHVFLSLPRPHPRPSHSLLSCSSPPSPSI